MDGVTLREYRDRLMALGESGGWVTVDDLARWVDCIDARFTAETTTKQEEVDGLKADNAKLQAEVEKWQKTVCELGSENTHLQHQYEECEGKRSALKDAFDNVNAILYASIPLPLDADGVPCRIGDLLETEEHIPRNVVGYYLADESTPCVTLDFVSPSIEASRLHHVAPEPPDSQERIDADAKKSACEYFGNDCLCNGCKRYEVKESTCTRAQMSDILRRQRDLDGAGEAR